jgi:hypothetical protein
MKKQLIVKTRWEYYAANIAGFFIMIGVIVLCLFFCFENGAFRLASVSFWIALLITLLLPFAIISFFSSMKQVIVSEKGLLISYVFKNHTSEVIFTEVVVFNGSNHVSETRIFPRKINDSFRLTMADGRVFEFGRSQFVDYDKMRMLVQKVVGGKKG